MANFRLWVHEQVSRLDNERAHRHVALCVAVLFLMVVFGAPALDFARGQTMSFKMTTAEDRGAGNLHMSAFNSGVDFVAVTFTATDNAGTTKNFDATGGSGNWFTDAVLAPGTYIVEATGVTATGEQFFSDRLTATLIGSGGATLSPPPQPSPASLELTTFAPEMSGSEFMMLKAISTLPLEVVNFKVSSGTGTVYDVMAENPSGDRLVWKGGVQVPLGDTYIATAIGTDAVGNSITSNELSHVLDIPQPTAPASAPSTTIIVKDVRTPYSNLPSRMVMEARVDGSAPAVVRFKVTSLLGTQVFVATPDGSGLWKSVHDMEPGVTYTVFAEAETETGEIVGSATFKEIAIQETTPPPSGTTDTATTTKPIVEEARIDIISPHAGDTFSGPVPLVAKISVTDALDVTFIVRNISTDSREHVAGLPGPIAGNWTAFFEPPFGMFDVRARAKRIDGSIFISDSIPFEVALPEVTPATEETPSPKEPALKESAPEEPVPMKTVAETDNTTGATLDEKTFLEKDKRRMEQGREKRLHPEEEVYAKEETRTRFEATREDNADKRLTSSEVAKEAKKHREEKRLHLARELSLINTSEPILAKDTNEQKSFIARVAFMPKGDENLEKLAVECRRNGISRTRCAPWLKTRYQARACIVAGAITKEACTNFIKDTQNRKPEANELIGIATREELESFRKTTEIYLNSSFRANDLPDDMKSMLALVPEAEIKVRMMAVADTPSPEYVSSPGLMTFDSDGDGLPDDTEKRIGTDPKNEDTDADGFLDGEEVRNGFNPIGEGHIDYRIAGIEKAMLEGLPIEEPRVSNKIDRTLRVIEAKSSQETSDDTSTVRLTGRATPNSLVSIFIYTYLPVVVTTTTDADGNWSYDFSSKLAEGAHEAYVSVNDNTGRVIARSEALSFFVKTARAVSEEEFLSGDVNVVEPVSILTRYFVGAAVALVILALGLVIIIVRRGRSEKSPTKIE